MKISTLMDFIEKERKIARIKSELRQFEGAFRDFYKGHEYAFEIVLNKIKELKKNDSIYRKLK